MPGRAGTTRMPVAPGGKSSLNPETRGRAMEPGRSFCVITR